MPSRVNYGLCRHRFERCVGITNVKSTAPTELHLPALLQAKFPSNFFDVSERITFLKQGVQLFRKPATSTKRNNKYKMDYGNPVLYAVSHTLTSTQRKSDPKSIQLSNFRISMGRK